MTKSDLDIIDKIIAGDKNAISTLISRHKDKSMVLAVRMLKNKEDAEEAVQDAFIRAIRGLNNFQRKANFSTWLYRILYNICCDYLLKKKHTDIFNSKNDDEEILKDYSDRYYSISENYEYTEMKNIVNEEIDKIDPIYSSILTLFYVQDFGYDEIVSITGLPLGTVKTRLSRGREIMRKKVIKRMGIKTYNEI
jgi:RNA polymerase sigma-70 factor, ECF subfamily